ncbi:MAG: asparagine synthase (glutamine-hydrolyzing) [Acidobacteria bacterium]|nr:asparagine synthase (glutamine-hydrolyzing) [Acidobacteriota bacterium]
MCGIAGIVGPERPSAVKDTLSKMTDRLRHRGPDATGHFFDQGVALGHLRLSIIDLSESANQPMSDSSNRFIITFNGEIYNYLEVRSKLPDYDFRTNSDTETILAAYSKFGPDCLALMNGMFAFAIWDTERRELFIARDRLGVKPLYYFLGEGVLYFASEIRALLASEAVPRRIDRGALRDYLQFQSVYAPDSIVEGIKQLPAGSFARFAGKEIEIRTYWSIEADPAPIEEKSESEVRGKVRELFRRSVERRLVSDVRLGAFLSGGIDSSAVVAMMSEISPAPVSTFSVNFAEKEFDESEYAETIARKFKTEHTSIRLGAADFLEQLPKALKAADSPSGDGVNTYVVSKATREAGLKVALSGVGGDELFAGYPNFLNWLRFRGGPVSRVPQVLKKAAGAVLSHSANSKYQRLGSLLSAGNSSIAAFYPRTRQVLSERLVGELTGTFDGSSTIASELATRGAEIAEFPMLSQFSIAEMLGYTQNVLLKDADQFSMASALEVREPFFDFELVEYVLRIPDSFKYPSYPKRLLVESLAPMLPDSIVHRKKMGFVLPWEHWMRSELQEFCERRIGLIAERDILDGARVGRLWRDFAERRSGVLWSHIWHIGVLAEWLEENGF